jgi:hypothetical protein
MVTRNLFLVLGFLILFTGCVSSPVVINDVFSETVQVNADGTIPTITSTKDKLHDGLMYSSFVEKQISSGQTIYLKANSTEINHILERRIFSSTTGVNLDYSIKLYEGGTDTSSSDLLEVYNVNRNYNTSLNSLNIYSTVSGVNLTNAKELPFNDRVISDKKFSQTSTTTAEYIMKPNTNYYLAITNNDSGVLTITLTWRWYEEP